MSTLRVNTLETIDGLHSVNVADLQSAVQAPEGALVRASNLSDLNNAATARSNLGLGTASTQNSTAFATSAQGAEADAAATAIAVESVNRANGDALAALKSNNLSDLGNRLTARANLGLGEIWVEDYGAVGDYNPSANTGTDDATAIQNAINAAQTLASNGGIVSVRLRARNYRCGSSILLSPTANCCVRFTGEGTSGGSNSVNALSGTRLFFTGATLGLGVAAASTNGNPASFVQFEIRNLGLYAKNAGATIGLAIGTNGLQIDGLIKSIVENVYIQGFTSNGIYITDSRQIEFRRVVVDQQGVSGTRAVNITVSTNTTFAGDMVFHNCDFIANPNDATSVAVQIGNAQPSGTLGGMGGVAGIHFEDCDIYYGLYGVYLTNQNTNDLNDIYFGKCSFDGYPAVANSYGLYISNSSTGNMNNVVVESGYFVNYSLGVKAALAAAGSMQSVRICNNYMFITPAGGIAFDQGGAGGLMQSIVIAGNTMARVGDDVVNHCAIRMGNACKGFAITGNTHVNNFDGSSSPTIGWVVKVDATTADGYTITGNTGQCATAAVADAGTTSNKSVTGNVKY